MIREVLDLSITRLGLVLLLLYARQHTKHEMASISRTKKTPELKKIAFVTRASSSTYFSYDSDSLLLSGIIQVIVDGLN